MADETSTGHKFARGEISDESLEKMRMLIGYPNPTLGGDRPLEPHYTIVTSDAIRHYANGYGDDNRLYCDPDYGVSTRWHGHIAPPMFSSSATWSRVKRVPEELKVATRGVLHGVHLSYAGSEALYFRPVYPGDRLYGGAALLDVREGVSEFSGGRSVITNNGGTTVNAWGDVVCFSDDLFVHSALEDSAKRAKNLKIELGTYTNEDLQRIDDAYENEFVRGADTLFYEDVVMDSPLPGLVKGPLTVRDIVAMPDGSGWGNSWTGALKLDYKNRKRMPELYGKNEFGAWDVLERLHWDPDFALAVGTPTTYDYGNMRIGWMTHAITNFAGDEGWLYRLRTKLRKFNFLGDTTWLVGEITGKSVDPALGPSVEIEVRCVNQRKETTGSAQATVLLASRVHGPVALPPAPQRVRELAPAPDRATPARSGANARSLVREPRRYQDE